MPFHVDYDEFEQMLQGIGGNCSSWDGSLNSVYESAAALAGSSNMSGAGAESVDQYIRSVHGFVVSSLSQLSNIHRANFALYLNGYRNNIDPAVHAVIDSDELNSIRSDLNSYLDSSSAISSTVSSAISSVADLIRVDIPGFENISNAHDQIDTLLHKLLSDIPAYEDEHYRSDFIDSSQLISSLSSFIQNRLSDQRNYKTDFSMDSLVQDESFIKLYEAYQRSEAALSEKKLQSKKLLNRSLW